MSSLKIQPTTLLGILAILGLLINLGMLATGGNAEADAPTATTVNPRAQQKRLDALNVEITGLKEANFADLVTARQGAFELFTIAEGHGVEVRSLSNSEPESEKLGRGSFTPNPPKDGLGDSP